MTSGKKGHGGYAIGYGKPPGQTRFRKGQSGNPSGRAIESPVRRAKALALEEAYRTVTVADGAGGVAMPAIQAIMRRQIALAMKGNGPAQRAVIAAVEGIEDEQARAAEQSAGEAQTGSTYAHMSDTEAARRIAYLLHLAAAQQPEFRAELAPELRATVEASWACGEAAVPPEDGDGEQAR
jgi:Family of unknown function (DUF5681)